MKATYASLRATKRVDRRVGKDGRLRGMECQTSNKEIVWRKLAEN